LLEQQKKDAITTAVLIFIISGAIMAVATGAMFFEDTKVTHVLDMAGALELFSFSEH